MDSANTISSKYLIGGELLPFPFPVAPVVQYRVAPWGQHRAKNVRRAMSYQKKNSTRGQNLQLRSGDS
jgi:hypothetical protein